jgi:hypothetical protein
LECEGGHGIVVEGERAHLGVVVVVVGGGEIVMVIRVVMVVGV